MKGKPVNERGVYSGRNEEFPPLSNKLSSKTSCGGNSIFAYKQVLLNSDYLWKKLIKLNKKK